MNYIANWAKQYIAAARMLIALLHIYVFFGAIKLAQTLVNIGIFFSFSQAIVLATIGFCTITIAGFFRKNTINYTIKKRLQRFRFFLMGISCTILITGFFSTQALSKYSIVFFTHAAFTKAEKKEKPAYENYENKSAFYQDLKTYYSTLSKKELRKELSYQLKELRKNSSRIETAIAVLLIIIPLAVALFGIMALSCSLACNGQGALALLVLVGGFTGIILLAIYLGKLLRKQQKKKMKKSRFLLPLHQFWQQK